MNAALGVRSTRTFKGFPVNGTIRAPLLELSQMRANVLAIPEFDE